MDVLENIKTHGIAHFSIRLKHKIWHIQLLLSTTLDFNFFWTISSLLAVRSIEFLTHFFTCNNNTVVLFARGKEIQKYKQMELRVEKST